MHIDGSITMTPELNAARGKKKINKQKKKKKKKKKTPFFLHKQNFVYLCFEHHKQSPLFASVWILRNCWKRNEKFRRNKKS
jgi:hypothetical protein